MGEEQAAPTRWQTIVNADPEWVEFICAGLMGAAGISLVLFPFLDGGAAPRSVNFGLLSLLGETLPLLGVALIVCAVLQVQAVWRKSLWQRLAFAILAAGWCLFTFLESLQLAGVIGIVLSMGRVLVYGLMVPGALWLPWRLLRGKRASDGRPT